jgi:hypothetical protein
MNINATDARDAHNKEIEITAKAAQQKSSINARFNSMEDAARRGQLNIVTAAAAGLNAQISPKALDQAKSNAQPLIDEIEQQKKAQLGEIDKDTQDTIGIIHQAFPKADKDTESGTAPKTAAPPTSAPPKAAATPAKAVAPAKAASPKAGTIGLDKIPE